MTDTNQIEAEVSAVIKRLTGCPDIIGYGGESLAGEISRALSARASAGEGGEWTEKARQMIAELRDYVVNERDAQVLPRKAASYQRELDDIDALLAAAPQPQQAPAQATEFARGLAEHDAKLYGTGFLVDGGYVDPSRVQMIVNNPPAHGDGEGLHHAAWSIVRPYIQPAAREKVNAALKESLTTRPTPEAQEARDAVDARRYRYLRDHCKREWYSDMPHNKGAPSLDIEFEARGHDLDAAIDAALALPAQGEGKNG